MGKWAGVNIKLCCQRSESSARSLARRPGKNPPLLRIGGHIRSVNTNIAKIDGENCSYEFHAKGIREETGYEKHQPLHLLYCKTRWSLHRSASVCNSTSALTTILELKCEPQDLERTGSNCSRSNKSLSHPYMLGWEDSAGSEATEA